ncbi:MAG: S41 family peptidase [Planctomycetota bacterium]
MHVEGEKRFTPDGKHLVFQQGRGDLVVLDLEAGKKQTLVRGFSSIEFDISYDGQWIAYSQQDNNFNREIWLRKLDGTGEPVNVSRHPDNESNPTFSPDGKILAFTGRRIDREVDIYYVYLQEDVGKETSRERRMKEAVELMKKKRKSEPTPGKSESSSGKPDSKDEKPDSEEQSGGREMDDPGDEKEKDADEPEGDSGLKIDLEGIHNRLRRISISDSYESGLLFSPDSKKLAFSASIKGTSGWYTVEFPDKLTPKLFTTSTGSSPVWSKEAGGILCLRNGSPARIDAGGKSESFGFEVAQVSSRSQWLRAGFDKAWLTMREVWYDDRFANHNWADIRRKYAPVAAQMHDAAGLAGVVTLMLGELNGSHLGFYPSSGRSGSQVEGWEDVTVHLGVRFDDSYKGPGLLVRDVIENGPADRESSHLQAGDVLLSVDGQAVDPGLDLTTILNGRLDRDVHLDVERKDESGDPSELSVTIRPTTYSRVRSLLYEHWLQRNRDSVEQQSDGKLGYLHIRSMNMTSFYEFERQLYNVGFGKDGLVIDVRDNGGGSTTDILLTALTQPRHAITVPRGGGQGYPQDRAIFASWHKPIIVLCNQNSYSNAEIFSHAIKTLGRGKVVGVQTAGGVVSTGSASINDVGRIRVPFRGWFLIGDGQDMERNGCLPHEVLWPAPGELPQGVDRQLSKAMELLLQDVGEGSAEHDLIYAAERDKQAK